MNTFFQQQHKILASVSKSVLVLCMVVLATSATLPSHVWAAETKVVFLTATGSGTWTVPNDFGSLTSIEAIGGGGGGRSNATQSAGGGGGAYARITSMSLTPGQEVPYNVATSGTPGLKGGDSIFGTTTLAGCATLGTSACVGAEGGAGATGGAATNGGSTANSVGTTEYAGGNGGTGTLNGGNGGGGGAAGPIGAGKNGGNGDTTTGGDDGGGGGGGSNGGSSTAGSNGGTAGGAGGNGTAGTGAGTGGNNANGGNGTAGTGAGGGGGDDARTGGNGATSTSWTQTSDSTTAGPGGGGGGAGNAGATGGNGGAYGGGGGGGTTGGTGGQGIIVITYTTNSNPFALFGTLFSDEGNTQITSGKTIKLAIGTSTPGVFSTTTDSGAGTFRFIVSDAPNYATGTPFVVWVDGDNATRAARFSKASSTIGTTTDFHLYQNRVIVSHEATVATTTRIADMAFYDSDDDSDIAYNASSTANTLTVFSSSSLYVAPGKHFVPGGDVTVRGNALSLATDGTLQLTASSTFEQSGTTTIAGSFLASTSANYIKTAGGLLFNATTTGKTIRGGTLGGGLGNVTFNSSSGGWSFADNASTSNFTVTAGSVTVNQPLSVSGTLSNSGTFTNSSGSLYFTASTSVATGTLSGTSGLGNVSMAPRGSVTSWISQSAASDNFWRGVAYGGGTFVAVSVDGSSRVMTSVDGIAWTSRSAAGDDDIWNAVTYGNGLFVAVGQPSGGHVVMTSSDGVTWAPGSAEGNDDYWTSITYGNGLFVAMGVCDGITLTQCVMTSPDGTTWTARSIAGNNDTWYGVTYGEGLFVAVGTGDGGGGGDLIATSPDGITWTARSVDSAYDTLVSVTYGDGLFVAGGVFEIMTSPDGITWTARTSPALGIWTSLTYGDGFFVGVAQENFTGYHTMTSSDGISWSEMPAVGDGDNTYGWWGVTYGKGTFVAVGSTTPSATDRVMTASNFGASLSFGSNASTTDLTVTASTTFTAPPILSVAGNYTNNSTSTMASTTYFTGTSKTIAGTLTGTSTLNDVIVSGSYTFSNNASTSDLTVTSSGSLTAPTGRLSVDGDFINSGTFTQSGGVIDMVAEISNFSVGYKMSTSTGGSGLGQMPSARSGNYLYVGKPGDATACTQVFGTAVGCELMVFDLTNPATPTFVAGRDISGNSTGTGSSSDIITMEVSGNYLYVGKSWDATACSQTPGSAIGCELMVFDISTPSDPLYVAGRDASGDDSGTVAVGIRDIEISGTMLYVALFQDSSIACSQIAGSAQGCVLQVYDISDPTNPTYVNGVSTQGDRSDSSIGQAVLGNQLAIGNGVLFLGKLGNGGYPCTQTPGDARACELMVFDISSTTNPVYVAGRDGNASPSGSSGGGNAIRGMAVSGNYLYVSKTGNTEVCTNTAGSAAGCEIQVYDISSTTNPVYITGRDTDGTQEGVTNNNVWVLETSGNRLYAGKAGDTGACADTAPTRGCELMVFDISSSTNPIYVGGRDSSGLRGSGSDAVRSMTFYGDYMYLGKTTSLTSCSSSDGTGCELLTFKVPAHISGNLTNTNTLGNVVVSGFASTTANASTTDLTIATGSLLVAPQQLTVSGNFVNSGTLTAGNGTTTFSGASKTLSGNMTASSSFNNVAVTGTVSATNNASTTNLLINSSASLSAPSLLTISGHYDNRGTFTANSGTTTFSGSAQQIATGTLSGSSAFYNLELTNTSQNGATTQSVVFGTKASSTNHFAMTPGSSAAFLAGATSTFEKISLRGTSGNYAYLRSTTPSTQWGLEVPGTQELVTYVNVRDSNACSGYPDIDADDGTSANAGNNTCWTFPPTATILSADDQTFIVDGATTTIETITITDSTAPVITDANNIRIAIATSSVNMRWDTTDTTATIGGGASGKVSGTVSYEGGGSVLVVDVTEDFLASDTITISGLSFTQFASATPATSALTLHVAGSVGEIPEDTDAQTVTITGALSLLEHGSGQVSSAFSKMNNDDAMLFRFRLNPQGESFSVSNTTFTLSGIDGIETADVTSVSLYRDYDGNGAVNGADSAIGGSGSVSISGQSGTITFSESFTATSSMNYLLIADVVAVRPADSLSVGLPATSIVTTGTTSLAIVSVSGSASLVQHIRGGGSGGSGAGGGASIGGEGPEGGGIQTGGGLGGGGDIDPDTGEGIGNEVGFHAPNSTGSSHNEWTNGANAYTSDGSYATATSAGLRQSYTGFGFGIPSGNQINGIEVKLEASASTAAGTIDVYLSWNSDSNVTEVKTTATLDVTDGVYNLGGASDTWGRSWTVEELADANFRVRVVAQPSGGNTVRIDALQVKIHHIATGGGAGGGGDIVRRSMHSLFAGVFYTELKELKQSLLGLRANMWRWGTLWY